MNIDAYAIEHQIKHLRGAGAFYKDSKKYLWLYVNELQIGFNNRMDRDIFGA